MKRNIWHTNLQIKVKMISHIHLDEGHIKLELLASQKLKPSIQAILINW